MLWWQRRLTWGPGEGEEADALLLPDLKFFRNPDFSVLRNGGQALCHNRNFKIQKHVQGREDKVWDHFSESVFWCFLGGGFYLFFISRLNGNVF